MYKEFLYLSFKKLTYKIRDVLVFDIYQSHEIFHTCLDQGVSLGVKQHSCSIQAKT